MINPPPTLAPISASNKPEAVDVLTAAFMNDPLFLFVVPDERERRRWLPYLMRSLIAYNSLQQDSRVSLDENGRITGVCLAGPYPPPAWQEFMLNLRVALRPWPWEPKLGPLLKIGKFSDIWKEMHWKAPHWYVYIIGVAPEHQRKGLGRILMRDMIERATTAAHPVYLETQTESNVPFYRALGFDVTEHHRPFEDGPGTWGMFRNREKA